MLFALIMGLCEAMSLPQHLYSMAATTYMAHKFDIRSSAAVNAET